MNSVVCAACKQTILIDLFGDGFDRDELETKWASHREDHAIQDELALDFG